ncbi:MAG TPA: RNA polymerase sigma factor SigM [Marmoricola sp.]|nr:RNA polymerase sigma factor SigM [Marmoricola sp.]
MTRAADAEPTDEALLAAHLAGDPDAFGVLITRHRDRLWAVALRTTGNPEEAADALQEAMISAFRRAGTFRGDALVTTWLHRIVVNACLDRLRRNRVRATQPLPEDLEEYAARRAAASAPGLRPGPGSAPSSGTLTAADDPEAAVLSAERRDAVLAALRQLPHEQRAALVLVDMEGVSVDEAARVLDCAPGTVKSRCSRGRARLARLLGEMGVTGTNRHPPPSDRGGDLPPPHAHGSPHDEGGVCR